MRNLQAGQAGRATTQCGSATERNPPSMSSCSSHKQCGPAIDNFSCKYRKFFFFVVFFVILKKIISHCDNSVIMLVGRLGC